MWGNVNAVSHFQPLVVIAELLIILTTRLPIGHIHRNILSLLQTQIVIQTLVTTCILCHKNKNKKHLPCLQWHLSFCFLQPSLVVFPLVWGQTWTQHGQQVEVPLWEETEQSSRALPTSWSSWRTWIWLSSATHRRRHPQLWSLLGEVWSIP